MSEPDLITRDSEQIRFSKVDEARAKIEAGTADMEFKMNVSADRLLDVIAPREPRYLDGDGFDNIEVEP